MSEIEFGVKIAAQRPTFQFADELRPEKYRKLCLALETANKFRKELASLLSDVTVDRVPSSSVWTRQDALQSVLRRQLQARTVSAHVLPKQVTTVVTTAHSTLFYRLLQQEVSWTIGRHFSRIALAPMG